MIALYVVLGLLLLALLLPAGVRVLYSEGGLLLKLIYGPLRIQLLPAKKKQPKKEKAKKDKKSGKKKESKKEPAKTESKEKKGGKLSAIMEYVPPILDFLQDLRVRLKVRRLILYVCLGGSDPCDTALLYGKLTAGAGGLIAMLEQWFRIKKRDIQVFCDFMEDETKVYADVDVVICPGRLLWLLLRYGWKLLRIFLKQNSKKAV